MVRWDDETKVKLLLAIIEHLNPTSLPWDKLANAMGREFTSEAVRGQYKTIKKTFKNPGPATPSSSSGKTANSTSAKPAKPATGSNPLKRKAPPPTTVITDDEEPTPAKAAKAAKPTSNPLKRKTPRATAITDDDDEEDEPAFLAPRSRSVRVKREQGKERGGGGEVFKMEEVKGGGEGVDVENEGLYYDDDDAA